jgi:hypothetical protein
MSCQLKPNEVTVFVCFIELKYKHEGSNYTQSPIELISPQLFPVSPLSFTARHSLCTRFVLFFASWREYGTWKWKYISTSTIMICNFPSPFSSFNSKNDIYDSTQQQKNSRKSFSSGLKMSKSFTSRNLLSFHHNFRPSSDANVDEKRNGKL